MINDDGPVTIDLLIVYTPAAAVWASNREGGINNTIASIMNKSQLALDNSNTNITFNLAHSAQVNYEEFNNSNDLSNLRNNNDGYLDEVHTWRDAYGADVVVLLEEIDYTGGQGYLLTSKTGSPGYAFSLTRVQQASWTYTVVHEIGHNMGLHHHKDQNTQPGPTGWWNWPENIWSAGGRWIGTNNGKYCSVMTYESGSYFADGVSHTRVPYFSAPEQLYQGTPTGDPENADNARTLREIKSVVAAYRTQIVSSPTNFTAMASGESQINLQWNLYNNQPVLIAFSNTTEIGSPVDGETYAPGDTIPGGGTVLYAGTNTGYNHSGLLSSTTYYYEAWSDLSGDYTDGVTANATTEESAIPENTQVSSTTVTNGNTDCFNATQTITVAGDDSQVIVESGASANFIAGQNIRFLPGFHAQEGSYILGYITTTQEYCVEAPPALVSAENRSENEILTDLSDFFDILEKEMLVYPNPNKGLFTVEFKNFESETRIMLFNSIGQLVCDELTNDSEISINVTHVKKGMYYLKAVHKNEMLSQKIIIQ